ncbi:hypothetical protein SLEP1_g35388 [Rubroshorea leprosula]|uniref:DUF7792 domain-containing protein n=1 Tax=Rubroshorea leprosula TaxID=152421 RepID=A0AAV5KN34_9ROSI|nr:hypothetical protein SLEP1_g35388 [Rubroshorea leprosula]
MVVLEKILMAERVGRRVNSEVAESNLFEMECVHVGNLVGCLRSMLHDLVGCISAASPPLYDRPIVCIVTEVSKNLERAVTLVSSMATGRNNSSQLEHQQHQHHQIQEHNHHQIPYAIFPSSPSSSSIPPSGNFISKDSGAYDLGELDQALFLYLDGQDPSSASSIQEQTVPPPQHPSQQKEGHVRHRGRADEHTVKC